MIGSSLFRVRIPIAGALAGVPFVLEVSPLITAIALTGAMRWVPDRSAICSGLRGFLFGTTAGLVTTSWVPEALRELQADWPSALFAWGIVGIWAAGPGYTAVGVALFVTRSWPRHPAAIAIATSVFVWERFCLSGSWGLPALLWAHPFVECAGLAQLATLAGIPGISALIVFGAHRTSRIHRYSDFGRFDIALAASWIGLSTFAVPAVEGLRNACTDRSLAKRRLLFVQPDLDRHDRWASDLQPHNLAKVAAFTSRALASGPPGAADSNVDSPPDLIFWPETLLTSAVDTNLELRRSLERAVHHLGVPVATGLAASSTSGRPETYRNAVAWVDPDRGITTWTYKAVAVPVVEAEWRGLLETRVGKWLGDPARGPHVEEVEQSEPLHGDFDVAILLCYEALFPRLAASRRTAETVALVNLADDSWISGDIATRQLTRFAAYRAIEQRIVFIRLAHGGRSAAYDEFGREIHRAELDRFASFWIDASPTPQASALERGVLLAVSILPGLGVWLCSRSVAALVGKLRRKHGPGKS